MFTLRGDRAGALFGGRGDVSIQLVGARQPPLRASSSCAVQVAAQHEDHNKSYRCHQQLAGGHRRSGTAHSRERRTDNQGRRLRRGKLDPAIENQIGAAVPPARCASGSVDPGQSYATRRNRL